MEANSRAPWLTSEPPGLKKSILSELFGEPSTKPAVTEKVSDLAAEDIRCALCSKAGSTAIAPSTDTDVPPCRCYESDHEGHSSAVCSDVSYVESKNVSTLLSSGCKMPQEAVVTHCSMSSEAVFKMDARSEVEGTNSAEDTGPGVLVSKENSINNNNSVTHSSSPADLNNQIGLTDAKQTENRVDRAAATTSVKDSECSAVDNIVH